MKILKVVEARGGGLSRRVRGLCRFLIAEGHHLTRAYTPDRADEEFRQFIADWQNGFAPSSRTVCL